MAVVNALCLVAHPDDCVIFAYSYIHNHPEMTWTIGYLTYTAKHPRGAELAAFWKTRGIECVFLGFEDDWHDNEQNQLLKWTQASAAAACSNLSANYDLVLTHDEHGDYGHIHHRVVHDAVVDHCKLVTFARPGQGTVTYQIPPGTYSSTELPMHGEIISSFHPTQHQNSYKETSCI
jgi:LmbE family N-acetylglucosaminyl deacetylase